MFRRFGSSESGSVAVQMAIAALPLLGGVGLAVDYSLASHTKASLQGAADASALAVGIQSGGDLRSGQTALKQYGAALFAANTEFNSAAVDVGLIPELSRVSVSAGLNRELAFPIFGDSWTISAFAEAEVLPGKPICLLALGSSGTAMSLSGSASFTAPDCLVHSNSSASGSFVTSGASSASAANFCTVGGGSGNFSPAVEAGCPPVRDPFSYLNFPSSTQGCNADSGSYAGGHHTIYPGVYCNGLWLKGTAKVSLAPGVYVIRDSNLIVSSGSRLSGEGVVFVLQGTATFSFEAGSQVVLKAPKTGDFSGVVIAQDPANSVAGMESRVHGGGSVELTGSVYLPNQTMTVSGGGNIGVTASQTAFVADRFNFTGNGTATLKLNMNSDFKAAGFSRSALAGKPVVRLVR